MAPSLIRFPTKDKRFIWVDSYARWRITDPLLFFQRLNNEGGAQSRLDDILDGETRNTIAKHVLIDVVRSTNRPFVVAEDVAELSQPEAAERVEFGRDALTEEVLLNARRRTGERPVYFSELGGFHTSPVYSRTRLATHRAVHRQWT